MPVGVQARHQRLIARVDRRPEAVARANGVRALLRSHADVFRRALR